MLLAVLVRRDTSSVLRARVPYLPQVVGVEEKLVLFIPTYPPATGRKTPLNSTIHVSPIQQNHCPAHSRHYAQQIVGTQGLKN